MTQAVSGFLANNGQFYETEVEAIYNDRLDELNSILVGRGAKNPAFLIQFITTQHESVGGFIDAVKARIKAGQRDFFQHEIEDIVLAARERIEPNELQEEYDRDNRDEQAALEVAYREADKAANIDQDRDNKRAEVAEQTDRAPPGRPTRRARRSSDSRQHQTINTRKPEDPATLV